MDAWIIATRHQRRTGWVGLIPRFNGLTVAVGYVDGDPALAPSCGPEDA